MTNPRVKLNIKGIREVLKSQPVIDELARRGARAARAAGPGNKLVVKTHKYTARVFVQTENEEAAKREAEEKSLTRSLDAAR